MLHCYRATTFAGIKGISWKYSQTQSDDDSVSIVMEFEGTFSRQTVFDIIKKAAEGTDDSAWLQPVGRTKWKINLDALTERFNELPKWDWLYGSIVVEPEVDTMQDSQPLLVPSRYGQTMLPKFKTVFSIYLTEQIVQELRGGEMAVPIEIQKSLEGFREDHPNPLKVAFLMMQFGTTPAHDKIVKYIRNAFSDHGITVLRADDKDYHEGLFQNVQTYMHGCGIGVALFERIVKEDFNPNVSLEIGYMLAMGKPICLLKDRTLKALPTDLVGRLYKEFDVQAPKKTIPQQVTKWLKDRSLT